MKIMRNKHKVSNKPYIIKTSSDYLKCRFLKKGQMVGFDVTMYKYKGMNKEA